MKKSIIGIIAILLIVGSIGSLFCGVEDAMRRQAEAEGSVYDPSKISYYLSDGRKVTADEFDKAILQDAMKYATGTVQFDPNRGKTGLPATSTPTNTTPASTPTKKTVPKVKLTVWFTDALGRVIGSSQVTKGTDIATSQFPQEVQDCEGMAFDHWDYDGRVIEHQFIIRAVYK